MLLCSLSPKKCITKVLDFLTSHLLGKVMALMTPMHFEHLYFFPAGPPSPRIRQGGRLSNSFGVLYIPRSFIEKHTATGKIRRALRQAASKLGNIKWTYHAIQNRPHLHMKRKSYQCRNDSVEQLAFQKSDKSCCTKRAKRFRSVFLVLYRRTLE